MSLTSDGDPLGLPEEARGSTPLGEAKRSSRARGKAFLIILSLGLFLLLSVAFGLWAGRGHSKSTDMLSMFLQLRAYRIAVGFFAGGALAVGGTIVQGLFRNPLASPEILGTNAGAALGGKIALLGTFLVLGGHTPAGFSPEMLVPIGCVVGAVVALVVVLSITSLRASPVRLLLTGFVLNGLFLGIGAFLSSLAQESFELQRAMSTLAAGSIGGSGSRQLILVSLLVLAGTLPTLFYANSLDVLLAGEEEASTLGVDVPNVRFWCVVWAALVTGGAVAVGANVGFIGLIIPHAVRRFTGPSHRYVIPASFVAGGAFLILCDAACRAFPTTHEIPLHVLIDLIGAPAFLWMLHRLGQENAHA